MMPMLYIQKSMWTVGRWFSDAVNDPLLCLYYRSLFITCFARITVQGFGLLRPQSHCFASNHVNDGRPIAAHLFFGPLSPWVPPPLPLFSPLSLARCPPPYLIPRKNTILSAKF